MNNRIRRELLSVLGRSAIAGVPLLLLRSGKPQPRIKINAGALPSLSVGAATPGTLETREDPLLLEASQWVDRLRARGTTRLVYPVSNLQREFRLGYARACALAEVLAQRGEWTVAYDDSGTRYARIHRIT